VVFVDDSVSASSRSRVDAEDFHGQRLGGAADVPATRQAAEITTQRRADLACPNESVAVTSAA
jgi:hypothetical protein